MVVKFIIIIVGSGRQDCACRYCTRTCMVLNGHSGLSASSYVLEPRAISSSALSHSLSAIGMAMALSPELSAAVPLATVCQPLAMSLRP